MDEIVTSAAPLVIPAGASYLEPLTITVENGTGSVSLQRRKLDNSDWITLEDEGALADGVNLVDRAFTPSLRVLVTGNGKAAVRGR